MKVGPTERICLLSEFAVRGSADAGAAVSEPGAGVLAAVAGGVAPFLAAAGFACGRCILLALSSVTMMSPCCSAIALSSTDFKASAQLCPRALQEQDGLYSVR